jgi:hypothetical protein
MTYSDQEIARMIAFISMLLSFMEFEWDSSADQIGEVENIAALCKAILEHVGQSPALHSLTFIFQCCAQGLLTMENQFFPDMNPETPVHLTQPLHCLPLSNVKIPAWSQHNRLIEPAFQSLVKVKQWIMENYSKQIHDDLITICDDALLLMETVADLCGTPVRNGQEFLA